MKNKNKYAKALLVMRNSVGPMPISLAAGVTHLALLMQHIQIGMKLRLVEQHG